MPLPPRALTPSAASRGSAGAAGVDEGSGAATLRGDEADGDRMPTRWRTIRALCLAAVAAGAFVRPARSDEPAARSAEPVAEGGVAALLDRALAPAQQAERAYLEHLGWRFVLDPASTAITVAGGTPCRRRDLAAAQAAGDLRILVPPRASAADLAEFASRSFPGVLDSIPSRGAWQLLMAPAVERATDKLSANAVRGRWIFPQWLVVNAHVFSMDPPKSQWVRRGAVCFARGKPSAAIEAFYDEKASSECYVAQIVASYAIQYELYGPAWFDEVFSPDEIAIGQVGPYHGTPIGKSMDGGNQYPWRALFLRPSDTEDPGLVLGRLGPLAFPGTTGILMDQNGTGRSNQNLTIVSVTPQAADSLVRHGGFPYVATCTQEFLTLEKSKRRNFVTGADLTRWQARIDELLSDPVFTGIRIYVHPYAVMTLGKMVDRLTRMDRTAVGVQFYDLGREDLFFQRYRQAWIDRWTRSRPPR